MSDAAAIDRKIIALLAAEPRITVKDLAARADIAPATARTRLRRIIREGIAVPTVVLHPAVQREHIVFHLRLGIRDEDHEALFATEELASAPWVAYVGEGDTILAQFTARDLAGILDTVDTVRARLEVESVELVVFTRIYLGDELGQHPPTERLAAEPHRMPDDVDLRLVALLTADGRANFTDLAAEVGLTVAATRRRVLRLVDDGIVRFHTRIPGPDAQERAALVDLTVKARSVPAMLSSLTASDHVRYVNEQTGPYNVACYVVARDEQPFEAYLDGLRHDPRVSALRVSRVRAVRHRASWTD